MTPDEKGIPSNQRGTLTEVSISPELNNTGLENVRTKRITGSRDIPIDPKLLAILSKLYPRMTVADALIRYSEEHEQE